MVFSRRDRNIILIFLKRKANVVANPPHYLSYPKQVAFFICKSQTNPLSSLSDTKHENRKEIPRNRFMYSLVSQQPLFVVAGVIIMSEKEEKKVQVCFHGHKGDSTKWVVWVEGVLNSQNMVLINEEETKKAYKEISAWVV